MHDLTSIVVTLFLIMDPLGNIPVFLAILKDVSSGQLTPTEAQVIANILDNRRRAIETEEHETRLRALEAQHAAG